MPNAAMSVKRKLSAQRGLRGFTERVGGARAPCASRDERPSVLSLLRKASFGVVAGSLRNRIAAKGRSGKTISLESAKKQQSGQWRRSVPLTYLAIYWIYLDPDISENSPA